MPHGILAYAAYLPRHRLAHEQLEAQLGARGGGGQRILASYDEDATTMAVEAARRGSSPWTPPEAVYFATTTPPTWTRPTPRRSTARSTWATTGSPSTWSARPARPWGRCGRPRARRAGRAVGSAHRAADLGRGARRRRRSGGLPVRRRTEAAAEIVARPRPRPSSWTAGGSRASGQPHLGGTLRAGDVPAADPGAVERALAEAGLDQPDHLIVSSPHARAAAARPGRCPGRSRRRLRSAMPARPTPDCCWPRSRSGPARRDVLLVSAVDGCDAVCFESADAIADGPRRAYRWPTRRLRARGDYA